MAVNQLKIVLSILSEISEGKIPEASDYDINSDTFYDILIAMNDDGLVKGVSSLFGDGVRYCVRYENVKITIKGMEYINANSKLMKTYRGLKEIREWLPF